MGLPDSQASILDNIADLIAAIPMIVERTWAADVCAAVALVVLMRVNRRRR